VINIRKEIVKNVTIRLRYKLIACQTAGSVLALSSKKVLNVTANVKKALRSFAFAEFCDRHRLINELLAAGDHAVLTMGHGSDYQRPTDKSQAAVSSGHQKRQPTERFPLTAW
jgi:hypothetical protein